MKKNKVILITTLLFSILFSTVYANPISLNMTDVMDDAYVDENNPTWILGTLAYWLVTDYVNASMRSYIRINNTLPQNVSILNAEFCASITVDGTTDEISIYGVMSSDWNETNINWNNQPCGTEFNESGNCDLTPQDTVNTTGYQLYCWDITHCFNESYVAGEQNASFVLKSPENHTKGFDAFISKEGVGKPYLHVDYLPLETNLTIMYNTYFLVNQTNLVQANYTLYNDSEPVLNATCNFTSSEGNATMVYNTTSRTYDILVIPETFGIVEFNVNCSKQPYEPQYEEKTYYSSVFAGSPYNFSVYLWENRNATTPYIDEFAYIILKWLDYNCTSMTGHYYCWQIEKYADGHADFNNTVAFGNVSLNYYSGTIYQLCDYCPPAYSSFNDFLTLGIDSFYLTNETERIDLWINPLELNFWTGIKTWLMTTGFALVLLVASFLIAMVLGIIVFNFGGRNATITIITVILTFLFAMLLFEQIFQIDIGLSSIINLILP